LTGSDTATYGLNRIRGMPLWKGGGVPGNLSQAIRMRKRRWALLRDILIACPPTPPHPQKDRNEGPRNSESFGDRMERCSEREKKRSDSSDKIEWLLTKRRCWSKSKAHTVRRAGDEQHKNARKAYTRGKRGGEKESNHEFHRRRGKLVVLKFKFVSGKAYGGKQKRPLDRKGPLTRSVESVQQLLRYCW
jgi:hypothetical protein